MKYFFLLTGAVLVLAGCGSEGGSNLANDVPERQEWCESFKRMENSTHGVEINQVSTDSRDMSLSQSERAAAATRYRELLIMPVNVRTDTECEGPVWDRFYEETKVRASSLASAPSTTTTTIPAATPKQVVRDPKAFIAEFDAGVWATVPLPTVGNYVCNYLDQGYTPTSVIDGVHQYLLDSIAPSSKYRGWQRLEAEFLFYGATRDMCPEHKDKVEPR